MVKKVVDKIDVLEETPVMVDLPEESDVEEEPKSIQKSKKPRTPKHR
jgi:hypothetical protein